MVHQRCWSFTFNANANLCFLKRKSYSYDEQFNPSAWMTSEWTTYYACSHPPPPPPPSPSPPPPPSSPPPCPMTAGMYDELQKWVSPGGWCERSSRSRQECYDVAYEYVCRFHAPAAPPPPPSPPSAPKCELNESMDAEYQRLYNEHCVPIYGTWYHGLKLCGDRYFDEVCNTFFYVPPPSPP